MKNTVIDEIDLKILRLLQDDARISAKSIADKLFLSAPTVKTRMNTLKEKGIIKGYYVEIDNSIYENVIRNKDIGVKNIPAIFITISKMIFFIYLLLK